MMVRYDQIQIINLNSLYVLACMYAANCTRRAGWRASDSPEADTSTNLGCTTNLSPTIGIITRHGLGDVGSKVETTTGFKLCMYILLLLTALLVWAKCFFYFAKTQKNCIFFFEFFKFFVHN